MRDRSVELLSNKTVEELTKIRKAQGLSHGTVAEKTRLNKSTISVIESHKRNPTLLTCLKIAKALNVRLGDVLNKLEK